MKKKREKLALSKETLFDLTEDAALWVVGGEISNGCTGNLTGTCPGRLTLSETCSCANRSACCPEV